MATGSIKNSIITYDTQKLVADAAKMEPFGSLSPEIIEYIFSYLELKDIANSSLVSRSWRQFLKNENVTYTLLSALFLKRWPSASISLSPSQNFLRQSFLDYAGVNFITELKYEDLMEGMAIHGDIIVGAFSECNYNRNDKSYLGIGNLRKKDWLQKIVVPEVKCVEIQNDKIISIGIDHEVKVWHLKTAECLKTWPNFDSDIIKTILCRGIIFKFSSKLDVHILNPEKGSLICLKETGPYFFFNHVVVHQNKIIGSCMDNSLKIYDLDKGELLYTLKGHEGMATAFGFQGTIFASGSHDYTIKVWDLERQNCLRTFEGHKDAVFAVVIQDNFLVSGSRDATVKMWDIHTGKCLKTFPHSDCIWHLAIQKDKIISTTLDKKIWIWDIFKETAKVLTNFDYYYMHVQGDILIVKPDAWTDSSLKVINLNHV